MWTSSTSASGPRRARTRASGGPACSRRSARSVICWSRTHWASRKGPVPTSWGGWRGSLAPSTSSFGMIPRSATGFARAPRNEPCACLRVIFTVRGSTTVTACTAPRSPRRIPNCTKRSMDAFTSSAATVRPLWNLTPGRSLKVYSVPSAPMLQLSASCGMTPKSSPMVTRPSNTCEESSRSVKAEPMWGSSHGRLVSVATRRTFGAWAPPAGRRARRPGEGEGQGEHAARMVPPVGVRP